MDAVFPKRCFYRKATVLVPYPIKLLDDIHEGFRFGGSRRGNNEKKSTEIGIGFQARRG